MSDIVKASEFPTWFFCIGQTRCTMSLVIVLVLPTMMSKTCIVLGDFWRLATSSLSDVPYLGFSLNNNSCLLGKELFTHAWYLIILIPAIMECEANHLKWLQRSSKSHQSCLNIQENEIIQL